MTWHGAEPPPNVNREAGKNGKPSRGTFPSLPIFLFNVSGCSLPAKSPRRGHADQATTSSAESTVKKKARSEDRA